MPARTERGNTRGSATLKRKIACTLLSINLHFLVHLWSRNCVKCLCARGQTGCDAWFTMLQKFTPLSTQKYRILFSRSGSLIDNFLGKCFVCCQSQTQGFCISKVQDPVQQIREFDWQFLGKSVGRGVQNITQQCKILSQEFARKVPEKVPWINLWSSRSLFLKCGTAIMQTNDLRWVTLLVSFLYLGPWSA